MALWQEFLECYNDVWENSNDYNRHKRREKNVMFLVGLNWSLDEVLRYILGRKPLPSIWEVFFKVRREEARTTMLHRNETSPNLEIESSILVSKSFDYEYDMRKKPWYRHFQKPWHMKETCWKLHGKPVNWKPKFKRDGRAYQAIVKEPQLPSNNS